MNSSMDLCGCPAASMIVGFEMMVAIAIKPISIRFYAHGRAGHTTRYSASATLIHSTSSLKGPPF